LGYPAVYRIHDSPHPDRIRTLAAFVAKLGFKLELKKNALNNDTASQKAMKHLLTEVKGTPVEFMVNEITLRTMAKAIYSEKNIGHYGLGFDFYTHFTSPIRRYPDLITHRLLFEYEALRKAHAKLTTTRLGFLRRTIPAICQNSSEQEKNASDAERESIKLKQVEYITDHIGEAFEGVISGVTEFGVYVKIDKLMIEGMVHIRNLRDDYYKFDERSYSVVGERRGKRFQMGQRVKVQVESTDIKRKTIDFALAPTT
ncbi:MAG: RNB domain-containing ribonuclease, partial [Rhizobacter sp.]|nr:RNB domain-containing ribonuclease [Chlorobiales bacterium]